LILPGLGQVVNRQIIKGLILMALMMLLFFIALGKFMVDLSSAMSRVSLDADLSVGREEIMQLLNNFQSGDLTMYFILFGLAAGVWVYSVYDAFTRGLRYQPPAQEV
jgi:hypothetical protein